MCCCCSSLSVEKAGASMVPGLATMSELCFNTVRSKHLHCALHAPQTVQANTDRVPEGSGPSKLSRVMNI